MKETIFNLAKAFIGESQARNRYDCYAKIAQKEGFEQIAEVFRITAENEKVHAKRLFEHIQGIKQGNDAIVVETEAPTVYGTTVENLKAAIEGENYEYSQMYPEFAKKADEEGLGEIASRMRAIAKAEEHHEDRYKKLLAQVENSTVFKKDRELEWVCRECGFVFIGQEPPEQCPSCDHPQSYYQVKCEQY